MSFPWCFPIWFCDFQFNNTGKKTAPKDTRRKATRLSTREGSRGYKAHTGHGR